MLRTAIMFALAAAQTDPFDGLPAYISHASGPALMAVIIVGALREWWVTGKQYERIVGERDQLLSMALRQLETQERALKVAELTSEAVKQ